MVCGGDGPHYDGPDYTPDGEWIWFNSDRSGVMQLWRVRTDGDALQQMTHDENVNWFPHPSPDGHNVVYLAYEPGTEGHPAGRRVELRLMGAGGGDAENHRAAIWRARHDQRAELVARWRQLRIHALFRGLREDNMASNIKGPAIFLAQFAGDARTVQFAAFDHQMGGVARLQGRADPDLGRAAVRSGEGRDIQGLLRRGQGHLQGRRRRDHRAVDASAGPARCRASGL